MTAAIIGAAVVVLARRISSSASCRAGRRSGPLGARRRLCIAGSLGDLRL